MFLAINFEMWHISIFLIWLFINGCPEICEVL